MKHPQLSFASDLEPRTALARIGLVMAAVVALISPVPSRADTLAFGFVPPNCPDLITWGYLCGVSGSCAGWKCGANPADSGPYCPSGAAAGAAGGTGSGSSEPAPGGGVQDMPDVPSDNQEGLCGSCRGRPRRPGSSGRSPGGGPGGAGDSGECCPTGLASWWVQTPHLSLFLRDQPMFYRTSRGGEVGFELHYKGTPGPTGSTNTAQPSIFGVGRNWETPWRSYLYPLSDPAQSAYVFLGDGSARLYHSDRHDYASAAYFSQSGGIYTLTFADGSTNVYDTPVTMNGHTFYFLTRKSDVLGQAMTFTYGYSTNSSGETNSIRLDSITDLDGQATTFTYVTNVNYLHLISEVRGPHGLTNRLAYNSDGFLTNITDAIGLTSGLVYDSSNRVSHLVTPYGTTRFHYYGSNSWQALRIEELGLRNHLYLAGYDPTVTVWPTAIAESMALHDYLAGQFTSSQLQTNDFGSRNTFYWGPLQYPALPASLRTALTNQPPTFDPAHLTTNDYQRGWSTHWLKGYSENNAALVGIARTVERAPSPQADGATEGALTWFDYPGKDHGAQYEGLSRLPLSTATRSSSGQWRVEQTARHLATGKVQTRTVNWTRIGLDPFDPVETYETAWVSDQFTYGPLPFQSTLLEHLHDGDLVSRHVINSAGWIVTNENARGEFTVYDYTSNRLSKVTRPSGWVTDYAYATNGFLASLTDKDHTTVYRTNSFTYLNGMLYTHTDERGRSVTNTYDALWRLTATRDARGTVGYTYARLDLAQVTNRLGHVQRYVYNDFGDLLYHTNATGTGVTAYAYCDCGSLESVTDPGGGVTRYTYDHAGRRRRTTAPDGSWIENTLAPGGEVLVVTDSAGLATTNAYTVEGRLYAAANAAGRLFLHVFDDEGRVVRSVDANGAELWTHYDALGRVVRRVRPHALECNGLFTAWSDEFDYTNDVAGPVAARRDALAGFMDNCQVDWDDLARVPLGACAAYAYDFLGRKTSEVHLDTNGVPLLTNTFVYSLAGDLALLRDGRGQETAWEYNADGQVTRKIDHLGADLFRYAYDPNGRLTNRWSPAKGDTRYAYDALGNLTTVDYANSPDLTLAYDANSRLVSMGDAAGSTTFAYTAAGAPRSEDGPWADDTVTLTYTTNRLRAGLSLSQPDGATWSVAYAHDAARRLTNVTSAAGAFGYQYHSGLKNGGISPVPSPASLIQRLTLPGGVVVTNEFDDVARWVGTEARNDTGTLLNRHRYDYNEMDQRTRQTRTAGDYVDYGYDGRGQLVGATGWESGGTTNRWHEQLGYAYDTAGNLNARTNHALVQTFAVSSLNQLSNVTRSGTLTVAGATHGAASSVTVATNAGTGVSATRYADHTFAAAGLPLANGNNTFTAVATAADGSGRGDTNVLTVALPATASFQYDANGNLIYDGVRALAYDDENQLTGVTVTNAWKSQFVYDARMRRRVRREYAWRNSAWVLTAEVRYVYDGNLVIQERDQLNQPKVTYTRGKDLSGGLEGAGGIGGLLARTEHDLDDKAHVLYVFDGNGNVTCLVDTNQAVVGRYIYDPFGNTLAATGPAAEANLYRFSSKELHLASGLIYYLYRYYDPSLQRWPNRDPIGENGGLNLFGFVANNPVSLSDAFGLAATGAPAPGNKWTTENCYQYACNNTGKYSDIPGAKKNQRCPVPYSCDGIKKAAMSDGLTEVPPDGKCPEGTHKVSYSVGQHGGASDFHLMRQDDDGTWSHKFRYGAPSKLDGSGNEIKDPSTANQTFPFERFPVRSSVKHAG